LLRAFGNCAQSAVFFQEIRVNKLRITSLENPIVLG
jgi:hypothetical protein